MSDHDQDNDSVPPEDMPEIAPDEQGPVDEKTQSATVSRGGNGVSWLAVLLAASALALVGWQTFQDWRQGADIDVGLDSARVDALNETVNTSNASIEALRRRVNDIQPKDFSDEIAAVRSDIGDKVQQLDSLPSRMSTLENSVASLAGISAGARETFLLREAEYYLQIANAQLQLANNPQLAEMALAMADERVTQMSNPGLIDVRRAISDERASLEIMEKPDLAGATLTLASLARVVESLPLKGEDNVAAGDSESGDDQRGTASRAWDSMKDAMSDLVKVTPPDRAKMALLSPDAEYFLRNNIAMQLQAARLALLRGEQTVFEQALVDATSLLDTYFDSDSTQVQAAMDTINEVRQSIVTAAAPDISGSLRLLRQFRTLSETTE